LTVWERALVGRGEVLEAGFCLLMPERQSNPALKAENGPSACAHQIAASLGMNDASPGRH